MPLLSTLIDKSTALKLKAVSPPIYSAEDLLSRCNIILSNELQCNIQEVQRIKLQVAGSLLHGKKEPMLSWMDLPSPVPNHNFIEQQPRSTGFRSLDELFDGGLPCSRMIEVLSANGGGKTQFCMSTILACAKSGFKVLVLSTNNDVSLYRLRRLLDFSISQDTHLITEEQKQDAKLFVLSHIYLQSAFDVWSAADLLCRVADQTVIQYDILVMDSMHALLAPCLTSGTAAGGLYSSASVSANMVSINASDALPQVPSVATNGPLSVSFQPLIANLYLLLRSLVDMRGMTVLVANVLEVARDGRALSTSTYSTVSGGGGGASYAAGGRSVIVTGGSLSAARLPVGTGASSSSDQFDIVLVLSARGEQKEADLFSIFTADIALRPPQYSARPSSCELRIAKI